MQSFESRRPSQPVRSLCVNIVQSYAARARHPSPFNFSEVPPVRTVLAERMQGLPLRPCFGRACHCGRGSFGPPPRRPLVTGAPVISRVSLNVNGAVREIESRRAPLCFLGFEDSAGPCPAAGAALIYSDTTGELFWDATGGTSDDQILIATLTGSPTLVSADILLKIATRSNR
jgi:hypothetical protein